MSLKERLLAIGVGVAAGATVIGTVMVLAWLIAP